MSVKNLKNLIYPVCEIAIQAGKVINKYYKKKTDILLKEDNSPLTQADIESNQVINNSLIKLVASSILHAFIFLNFTSTPY